MMRNLLLSKKHFNGQKHVICWTFLARFFQIFLFAILTFQSNSTYAAWRASTQSGDWANTATWGGLSVPVNGDQVSIGAGHTVSYYGDLTKTAGQLEINGGRLNIVGNLTLGSSVLSGTTSLGGQLFVYGDFTQQSNFQINGGATVVVMNNMNASGDINVNNGLLVVNGNLTKSNAVTVDNNSDIVVAGNYTSTAGDTWINSGNAYVFDAISCSGSNCNLIKNNAAWTVTPTHPGYQYLTNATLSFSSNGTFTVPSGVTSITVECWGGGGGGGNTSHNGNGNSRGGGGAGGSYAKKTIISPSNSYSLQVGRGGIGGNDGEASWFGSETIVKAQGGQRGASASKSLGISGLGSTAQSVGDVLFAGGNGASAFIFYNPTFSGSGGGGGGAGSTAKGKDASNEQGGTATSDNGGAGGNGITITSGLANGNSGSLFGGGGSGAVSDYNPGTARTGGSGANGQIIISWSSCTVPVALTANAGSNASCTQLTANWAASSGATTYRLDVSTAIDFSSFVAGYTNLDVGNVTTYNVTGLTAGTTYYYRVRANNTCGTSASSGVITYATLPATPAVPTASAGTAAACSQITANWTASTDATKYYLDVSTASDFSSFVTGYNNKDVLNVTTYNVTSLTAGTTYYYRVRASNTCGTSDNSTVITYATLPATPAVPTAGAGTAAACSQITANWTASTDATKYYLDVSTASDFSSFVTGYSNKDVGNVTTYNLTGLSAGTTYYYRVRANNSCGTSVSSSTISYSTLPNASIVSVTGTSPLCNGSTTTYLANTVVLGGGTGAWSSSDTNIATVNSSGIVTGVSAGTCNIIYTITGGCGGTKSAQQSLTVVSPVGDPAIFGNNIWNVYAYNGLSLTDLNAITYRGYYTDNNLGFDTRNKWLANSTPSSASGYQGCSVVQSMTFVSKRKGFQCGQYTISVGHDDDASLYVNGVLVPFSLSGWTYTPVQAWTGFLDENATVELRVQNTGGGDAYGELVFAYSAIALPTASAQTFCSASNPTVADLAATATGTLNWYTVSSGGTALSSGTALSTGIYYVSQTVSGCESARTSIVVTVNPTPEVPTGSNQTKTYTGVANATAISAIPGSGETIDWYDASTGGNIVATGSTTYTPTAVNVATYTYYAEARNISAGCLSGTRTGVTLTINKANSTIVVTGSTSFTYTGSAQGPNTSTVSGSTGVVNYSYSGTGTTTYLASATRPTNAGTYQVIATVAADANYNGATFAAYAFTINKANAVITVTPYAVTYDGNSHTSAGTATGVETPTPSDLSSLLTLSGTTHIAAGTYNNDAWSFAGNSNYNSTFGTVNNAISQANSTIAVTGSTSFTYNGSAQGPTTSTVTGSTGAVIYSYSGTGGTSYATSATRPTNAGTYQVIATVAADANYNGAMSVALPFTIGKATPVVTATVGTYTYNGLPQGPTAASNTGTGSSYTYSYVGVSGTTYDPSATQPTNAGSYNVTVTVAASADGNYDGASSAATPFTIGKLPLSITANSRSKCFGQTISFAGTEYASSGLIGTDAVTSVTLTSAGAASSSIAGNYPITPSAATGTGLGNYAISYINGSLTVNPLPTPNITGDTSPCNKTTGLIYSTGSGMSDYTWTISAGGAITSGQGTNSITVSWNTDGSQSLGVSYKNSNGCSGSVTSTITVHPIPAIGSFN